MKKSNAKDLVLEVITQNPGCDTNEIKEQVNYGIDTVRKACKDLVTEGKVQRAETQVGSVRKFLFNIVEEKETSRETLIKKAKASAAEATAERNKKAPKNRERVAFKGEEHGKAKLVRAIVIDFVAENPNLTYAELAAKINFDQNGRRVYPKYDVIRPTSDEQVQKSITGKYKRYYVNDLKVAADGVEFAICREWGLDNIDSDFIDPIAKEQLGYNVDNFTK